MAEVQVEERISTSLQHQLQLHGLEQRSDGSLTWRSGNKSHPRNWSLRRKCYDTALVIFLEFFTSAIGTAGVPASEKARLDFGLESTLAVFLFISVYLLGQGIGGIIFPPYSESYGRRYLYIISTALYSVFCIVIAAVPSLAAVVIGRFITGCISAIPTSVAAGSIEDLFDTEARIWVMFIYVLLANIGLVLGTLFGTYTAYTIGWQWIFYIAAIGTGLAALLCIGMKESRPSQLLAQRLRSIQKATGDTSIHIRNPDHVPSFGAFVKTSLWRPLYLLCTEPIVFIVSLMTAVAFGLIYLFTESLQVVYLSYDFSIPETSLAFIPVGLGLFLGIFTRLYDHRLFKRQKKRGEPSSPEDSLMGFAIAAPVLAIFLWWFSWTVPPRVNHVPWIVSMIALVPIGFAFNEFDCVLATYMADSYTLYSASAFASLAIMRTMFSATLPLFARQMYVNLGANYASTILAALATVACISPIILIKYGRRIREMSKFARYSVLMYEENRIDGDSTDAVEITMVRELDGNAVLEAGK